MSTLLKTLFPCLLLAHEGSIRLPTTTRTTSSSTHRLISEKPPLDPSPSLTVSEATTSILTLLLSSPSPPSPHLPSQINLLAHQSGGWSEYLASKILSALESVLKEGKVLEWNEGFKLAYEKACEAAEVFEGFVKEHPVAVEVFVTVLALGVVAVLVPEVLGWLGFGEVGIVEGSLAARWQATYMGLVPKGSLFSFFQRMGMTKWRWMGGIVVEK